MLQNPWAWSGKAPKSMVECELGPGMRSRRHAWGAGGTKIWRGTAADWDCEAFNVRNDEDLPVLGGLFICALDCATQHCFRVLCRNGFWRILVAIDANRIPAENFYFLFSEIVL